MSEQSATLTAEQATEWLEPAYQEAKAGYEEGGIPIGAALIIDGKVRGSGRNRRVQQDSPILHGETDCLNNIGRMPASEYARATMVTTLSPCDMCTGAILLYGIPRVIIGESSSFYGGEDYLRERGVEVINLDDERCKDLMQRFMAEQPTVWNEDIGEEDAQ